MATNLDGNFNTAGGTTSMFSNSSGSNNTSFGVSSLYFNTSGSFNTSIGTTSMLNNTSGNNNLGIGFNALSVNSSGSLNTGVGSNANTSANNLSNSTSIGNQAISNASNKVRLGNTLITVIEGQVPYSNPSDARFKFNVKENIPGLDFILKLKPVSYNFDTEKFEKHLTQNLPDSLKISFEKNDFSESKSIIRTGFLAQDVEKIIKSINYDFDGLHIPDSSNPTDNYSIAYSQFVVPLVKATQEQQELIEKQAKEIETLKSENEKLKKEQEKQKILLEKIVQRLSELEKK
jgi:hypothetical protein